MEVFEEYKDPIHPQNNALTPQDDSPPLSVQTNASSNESQIRTLNDYVESHKLKIINYALQQCGNNKTLAARKLGISTNTLWRIRKKGARRA